MSIRVLLIEDDEDDYILTRDLLAEAEGNRYDLHWVESYGAGLEALGIGGHDICLVDFRLGPYTGLDLLRESEAAEATTPIILLTGAGDRDIDIAAMEAGAADYLDKSGLTAPLLDRSIRYAISQTRTHRNLIENAALLQTAKDEAEIANRTKSEFLANVSHELRTPLNAIIGFAEIIRDDTCMVLTESLCKEYSNDIHVSATHLLRLINDILDISKVEARKIDLRESVVDVTEVTDSALRLVEGRAGKGGVRVVHKKRAHLPLLRVDEQRLKQMLLNLLSNAVKFTTAEGQVEIEANNGANGFAITVTDTGIGIAETDIPKALEPFSQLDGELSRRYEGTGLGLPLTKALVELHGGSVKIDSKVGRGTAVTLTFPLERVVYDAS